MTQEVAIYQTVNAPGFTSEQKDLIKHVAMAPEATDDEFRLFLTVAGRLGLDPLVRQIYAIHRKSGDRSQMTIQTGIDGYRAIAERTGKYAGSDDAVFDTEDADHPNKATVTVWRYVQGVRCPFTASARWQEYRQTAKNYKTGEVYLAGKWGDMPYNQLAKCAEALALRKAFPAQLAGVYVEDEMDQASNPPSEPVPADTHPAPIRALPANRPAVTSAPPAKANLANLVNTLQARCNALGMSVEDREAVCVEVLGKARINTLEDYHAVAKRVGQIERDRSANVAAAQRVPADALADVETGTPA